FRSPVWQRGFSEVRIHDADAFAGVREYIAQNPVKRRLSELERNTTILLLVLDLNLMRYRRG
ncbi:MAG: hypothetical protein DMG95_13755, partial [Acidobacteria bacterium]